MRSIRRGSGSDVAGSRPYVPGDDVHAIDWAASARRASARASDEFVVRELYADEAPRVVTVSDRRPGMSFFSPPLPWLDKARALEEALSLIRQSAALSGGFVGHVDFAGEELLWEPPRGGRGHAQRLAAATATFEAPADCLQRAGAHLDRHRRALGPGTFVFVLSDFIPAPPQQLWLTARERRWDVVPVVIQDPTWEQSFPDTSGITVDLRDPVTQRVAPVRLTAREARARREANEERRRVLEDELRRLALDAVWISSGDRIEILVSFLRWAELRKARRGV
jgi:uncharacterized protein (DUF58 family)